MKLTRQRGVAVITALLLTTLAVTIVASLFWQQQVQVRSMENQRLHLQTKWILRGALDWARLVLRQDGMDNANFTSLTSVWNTPLAETRLDQYIERERVEGEVFDATLSGRIIDATSRYNLKNLSDGRLPNFLHVGIYKNLLRNLQIDPALALRTAEMVASTEALPPKGMDDQTPQTVLTSVPIELKQLDDLLAIPGYTVEIVAKLREFVIILPEKTKVNVNTAPPEVIAAIVENYSVAEASGLVARRKQAFFRQDSDFTGQLFEKTPVAGTYSVKSEYFLVLSRVRLDRATLEAEALVERKASAAPVLLSIRQH